MPLLEYNLRDEKNQLAENTTDQEKRLVSRIRKPSDGTVKQGSNIQGRATGVPIKLATSTRGLCQPEKVLFN